MELNLVFKESEKLKDGIINAIKDNSIMYTYEQIQNIKKLNKNGKGYIDNRIIIRNIEERICKVGERDILILAFFKLRNICKINMYKISMDYWSMWFRISNLIFCKIATGKLYVNNLVDADEKVGKMYIIDEIISYAYEYWNNVDNMARIRAGEDVEAYNKYIDRISYVSNLNNHIYNYKIIDEDIIEYLKDITNDLDSISNEVERFMKERNYVFSNELLSGELEHILKVLDIGIDDDLIIFNKSQFLNLKNERFKGFISIFSNKKIEEPEKIENELIFSVFYSKYVFVSKSMMSYTQNMIEEFLKMDDFESITEYYFGFRNIKNNIGKFDRLLTYYIADLLKNNGYVLPLENTRKKKENKLLTIPKVEIRNIGTKDLRKIDGKDIGDIDILFYSKVTKVLYNLEFKNLQMHITDSDFLTKDINPVIKKQVVKKTLCREAFIEGNETEIKKELFENTIDISEIKSIILTSKPNYYFYKYKDEKGYKYLDWIEFKDLIERKKL